MRTPEEDRGTDQLDMDLSLDVGAAGGLLSPHIPRLCSTVPATTFASARDLKAWVTDRQGKAPTVNKLHTTSPSNTRNLVK